MRKNNYFRTLILTDSVLVIPPTPARWNGLMKVALNPDQLISFPEYFGRQKKATID
jgi:hypothetical protein